jgi:hypothetical protein
MAMGDEQDIAFETLKQQLISVPILGYANFELPFEIHTDAWRWFLCCLNMSVVCGLDHLHLHFSFLGDILC